MLKIEANRLELLSAAQDAEKVAPTISPVKLLECALLTVEDGRLTVCATNLELCLERTIPVKLREEGTVAVNAILLSSMLRLLPGDTVTLTQTDNASVTLSAGDTVYSVMTQDPKEYPRLEIPFPEDTVTVSGLPAMTRRTAFATGADDKRPWMGCVHLTFADSGLKAVGSDGLRIAEAKGESKGGSVDLLLPAASLEKLAQMVSNKDEFQVGITNNSVVFMKEGFLFSARRMEGQYMDTERVLAYAKPEFVLLTDAEVLRGTMNQAYTVTGDHNRFSMTFNGGSVRMTCDSEYGNSSTELEAVALTGTPTGTYWYSPDKLMACFRALSGTVMLKVCQMGALVMETDELTCMQMAMREPSPYVAPAPKEVESVEKAAKKSAAKASTKKKQAGPPKKEAA